VPSTAASPRTTSERHHLAAYYPRADRRTIQGTLPLPRRIPCSSPLGPQFSSRSLLHGLALNRILSIARTALQDYDCRPACRFEEPMRVSSESERSRGDASRASSSGVIGAQCRIWRRNRRINLRDRREIIGAGVAGARIENRQRFRSNYGDRGGARACRGLPQRPDAAIRSPREPIATAHHPMMSGRIARESRIGPRPATGRVRVHANVHRTPGGVRRARQVPPAPDFVVRREMLVAKKLLSAIAIRMTAILSALRISQR